MASDSRSVLRTSRVMSTLPGIMLIMFGVTVRLPTVPTFSLAIPFVVTISSSLTMNSAAPMRASFLSFIGVAPAWSATPSNCIEPLLGAAITVTIPAASPDFSSTLPCSMCSSR